MIAQSQRTTDFKAVARYLERPKPQRPDLQRVAWIEPRNLVCTSTLQRMAWEMSVVARGNHLVQKPVLHMSVSWAPEDEPQRWHMASVADEVMQRLSLADHQAIYVAHGDEEYKHIHVVANVVHPRTLKTQKLGLYYRQVQAVLRHAERRYGFREVPGHRYLLPGQRPPDRSQSLSKGAYKALCLHEKVPFQVIVRRVAEQDFSEASSWRELAARLRHHGLRMEERRSGLVVTDGTEYVKSSSIAPYISRKKLEQRFGASYMEERDHDRSQTLERSAPSLTPASWQWKAPERSADLGL